MSKKRRFLDKLNKEIDNFKLMEKKECTPPLNTGYYDANVQGLVRARNIYLRVYEGGQT